MAVAVTQVTHTKQDQAATAVQAEHVATQANHGQTVVDTVIAAVVYLAVAVAAVAHHMAAAGADLALYALFGVQVHAHGLAVTHITYNRIEEKNNDYRRKVPTLFLHTC